MYIKVDGSSGFYIHSLSAGNHQGHFKRSANTKR